MKHMLFPFKNSSKRLDSDSKHAEASGTRKRKRSTQSSDFIFL